MILANIYWFLLFFHCFCPILSPYFILTYTYMGLLLVQKAENCISRWFLRLFAKLLVFFSPFFFCSQKLFLGTLQPKYKFMPPIFFVYCWSIIFRLVYRNYHSDSLYIWPIWVRKRYDQFLVVCLVFCQPHNSGNYGVGKFSLPISSKFASKCGEDSNLS